MRKFLYSILTLGISLAGCTHFDEVSSVNYGEGPAIGVEISNPQDETFTFTLTPAEGTVFYSYVVVEGTEPEALDGKTLLQNQYEGIVSGVLNTENDATFSFTMEDEKGEPLCTPNTSYVVYAVAASKEGITGEVASAVVVTSDGETPFYIGDSVQPVEGESAIAIPFSEAVYVGEGAVTAKYFVEWEGRFVDIAAEDVTVSIEGNVVTVTTNNVPTASNVFISWEAGAFVDSKGNPCAALTSGLNSSGTDFAGIYFQVTPVAFEITEDNMTITPEVGSAFGDWSAFEGKIEFEMDVYRNDNLLAGGELQVVYSNPNKMTTINLAATDWSVEGNTLTFVLPEAPTFGDNVSLIVHEGAITDVYGNPNAETTLEDAWLCSYQYTRDMVIGEYTLQYYNYSDYSTSGEMVASTENITVKADPGNEDGLILTGFLGTTGEVKAILNGDYATVTFPAGEQVLGTVNGYVITLTGNTADGSLVMNVDANGNFSYDDIGLIYYAYSGTPADDTYLGMYEAMIYPAFVKNAAATTAFKVAHSSALPKKAFKLYRNR